MLCGRFQDSWAAKYPWCEQDPEGGGKFEKVRCIICSKINGREKKLDAKDDNLKKHQGWKKALNDIPALKVKKGEWFWDSNSVHKRAERAFAALPIGNIASLVAAGAPPKRKEVQMVVIFHLLQFGRPMTEYPPMKDLLHFLGVPKVSPLHIQSFKVFLFPIFFSDINFISNGPWLYVQVPLKHWTEGSGWEMAESLMNVVQTKTREIVSVAPYFSVSCDEVTTLDNQSWISIHVYTISDWERVSYLLNLERVTEGGGAENIAKMIVSALTNQGGLTPNEIRDRFMAFGADGASVLQGKRNGVTTKLQVSHAPHMQGMHCVAHRSNLAVQCLSDLEMVARIENLLAALHRYFSKSPKRHLELQKLAELLDSKGKKILQNIKTRWISMLSPLKRVLSEYRILLVKMYADQFVKPAIPAAKVNYELMADIKCLLTLAAVVPLLEVVKALVVFAQSPSVYVCDFTRALNLCIQDVHDLYCSPNAFVSDAFSCFKRICELSHESIRMRWHPDVNDCVEHLVFEAHLSTSAGSHLNATCINPVTHMRTFVTQELFNMAIAEVKVEVAGMYS